MKDEATVLTAANDKSNKDVEKRLTQLEVMVRKLKANSEIHWGKDLDGDGKVGSITMRMIGMLGVVTLGVAVAVAIAGTENRVADWATGQHTAATAYIDISPGGTATAVFDVVQATIISGVTTASGGGTWLGVTPMLSKSATATQVVDRGTIVINSLGGGTQSFTTAFCSGSTPVVLIQPYNTCSTNPYPAPAGIASNQFVIVGDALTTNGWIAIGSK